MYTYIVFVIESMYINNVISLQLCEHLFVFFSFKFLFVRFLCGFFDLNMRWCKVGRFNNYWHYQILIKFLHFLCEPPMAIKLFTFHIAPFPFDRHRNFVWKLFFFFFLEWMSMIRCVSSVFSFKIYIVFLLLSLCALFRWCFRSYHKRIYWVHCKEKRQRKEIRVK